METSANKFGGLVDFYIDWMNSFKFYFTVQIEKNNRSKNGTRALLPIYKYI